MNKYFSLILNDISHIFDSEQAGGLTVLFNMGLSKRKSIFKISDHVRFN